jgi:hypothetical protein
MAFVGTEMSGYRVSTDENSHLEIESWGFWDPNTASAFEFEAIATCNQLQRLRSLKWNAADMKPQADHGRAAIRALMVYLSTKQLRDCEIVADNTLTMMQFKRIARESGLDLAQIRDSFA